VSKLLIFVRNPEALSKIIRVLIVVFWKNATHLDPICGKQLGPDVAPGYIKFAGFGTLFFNFNAQLFG